ncbi:MAG: MBL fold metallo-hydrolase [Candidatus Hodarchaeales archaeon]
MRNLGGNSLNASIQKVADDILEGKFASHEELMDELENFDLPKEELKIVLAFLIAQHRKTLDPEKKDHPLAPELGFLSELSQFYWVRAEQSVFPEQFYFKAVEVLKILWKHQMATVEDFRPVLQGLYLSGSHSTAFKALLELIAAISAHFPSEELIGIWREFGIPLPQSEDRETWAILQESTFAPSRLGLLLLQRPEYTAEIIEAHSFQEIWLEIRDWASHGFISSLTRQATELLSDKLLNELSEDVLTPDELYGQYESLLTLGSTIIPLWYPEIISKLQNRIQPYSVAAEDLSNTPKRALQISLLKKGFQRRHKDQINIRNLGGARIGHSGFLIEYGASKILLDFGLSVSSWQFAPWMPSLEFLDAICISHGHLDHLGGLPFLYREDGGLECPWYAIRPTDTLAKILMNDNRNISRQRSKHLPSFSHPTFSAVAKRENISRTMEAFSPLEIEKAMEVAPDIFVTAISTNHIPGSVAYLVEAGGKRILYTGDMNLESSPLFAQPVKFPKDVDVSIFDGTYFTGESFEQKDGREALIKTVIDSERTIIPAFSVGRTQEVIKILSEAGLDKEKDVVTTGMSGKVCKLINLEGNYRIQPAYDYDSFVEGSVFVGGSGMLQGGVSRELLEKTRNDPKTSVILCGYLAPRTLGSDLRNGRAKSLYSQKITYARISAHTTPNRLTKFIDSLTGGKNMICHVGALSGFKTPQDTSNVYAAARKKNLDIFEVRKEVSLKV